MKTTTQIIAKEGYKNLCFVFIALVLCLFFNLKFLAFICGIFFLTLLYFYRNSERIAESIEENVIIAPLDGVIKDIIKDKEKIKIFIKKPICFCSLLRAPFKCEIARVYEVKGLANGDSTLGERVKFNIYNKNCEMGLILYKKSISNIVFYDGSGFRFTERFGFFLSGNAILELPLSVDLRIQVGDRILAGETLIAEFIELESKI
ncbi:MAG: hypothetical protein SOW25_01425 [Helicobacter sp.]|nr:hypothetical protein [Helicobacteraceae bacterium]MDY3112971.1 hypothetical protein [Helicobacter sp.]